MVNAARIDEALRILAVNGRFRFNAHQVAYLSQHEDVNAVYHYLVSREPYVVHRVYEVMCPFLHSSKVYYSVDQIPNTWQECRICGEEFLPDPERIHVVFYFNQTYLDEVQREQKKSQRPTVLI